MNLSPGSSLEAATVKTESIIPRRQKQTPAPNSDSIFRSSVDAKFAKVTLRSTAEEKGRFKHELDVSHLFFTDEIVDRIISVPPTAAEMGVKQSSLSPDQLNELSRINKLVSSKVMKEIEASILKQEIRSTQKLPSDILDWLDALIVELSGGKLRTCYEYKNRGT